MVTITTTLGVGAMGAVEDRITAEAMVPREAVEIMAATTAMGRAAAAGTTESCLQSLDRWPDAMSYLQSCGLG